MGRMARADIAKAGQQDRSNEIEIAQHRGMRRQYGGDPAQLAAIEQLAVRKMHVCGGKWAHIDDLTHAVDDGS